MSWGAAVNEVTKKRRPFLAASLSLLSLGLGQLYNGELHKGLVVRAIMLVIGLLYSLRIYLDGSIDFAAMAILVFVFMALKAYSMSQAFMCSRRLGSAYVLARSNRVHFYVVFCLGFLALNFGLSEIISQHAASNIGEHHPFRSEKSKERFLSVYDQRARQWPVASETRLVETSFGSTLVRISGPKDAPALALLHGVGGNSLQWWPNIKALSQSHRTYAIDGIYGHGRSVYTRLLESPEDFVRWLDELFDALGLQDDISLMGLSYGGWQTAMYALRHPQRLRKVVLLAPVMTVLPLPFAWIWRAVLCLLPDRSFLEGLMVWMHPDLAKGDQKQLQWMNEEIDAAFLALRCFKPKPMVNPTLLTDAELGSLRVPTLFLVGENERIYSATQAIERLQRVAPQIETEIIQNAGHDLLLVQPDLVVRKILVFLK